MQAAAASPAGGTAAPTPVAVAATDEFMSPLLVTIYISTIAIYGVAVVLQASLVLNTGLAPANVADPPEPPVSFFSRSASLAGSIGFEAVVAVTCVVLPAYYLYLHSRGGLLGTPGTGNGKFNSDSQERAEMIDRVYIPQHPGHALIPAKHGRNLCDLCGTKGTDFRCSAGCDYDVCGKCCDSAVGSKTAQDAKPGWAPPDGRSAGPDPSDEVSSVAPPHGHDDAAGEDAVAEPTLAEQWLDTAASSKAQMGDGADGEEDPAMRSESSGGEMSWQEEMAGYHHSVPTDAPLEPPPMPKMFAASVPACAGDAAAGYGASARMPPPPSRLGGQTWWDPSWGSQPQEPPQRRRGVSAPHAQQQWQGGQMWLSGGEQWMQSQWGPDAGFGAGATASGFGRPAPQGQALDPAPQVHSL